MNTDATIFFADIMDLKYVLIILLKILISTPTTLLILDQFYTTEGAALLGDPFINRNNFSSNTSEEDTYYDYDLTESQELEHLQVSHSQFSIKSNPNIPCKQTYY